MAGRVRQFVVIQGEVGDSSTRMGLPVEADNGIRLSTLRSMFPGASSLKYWDEESEIWMG
jgi:hypothetical protein